jgi:predicted ATP-grasp superfamily ATP-dependent carboligase
LPAELVRAGFEVSLLAPRESLVTRSKYVSAVSHLPDAATPMQWAQLLAAGVRQRPPRLIVPCDDTALQLMMAFLESPPGGFDAPLREQLMALMRESLGDPSHYRTSIDKTLLPAAAEALGVRVPAHAMIADPAAAKAFARTHGFPVVLKRAFGTAGQAVSVVAEDAQLEAAFRKLASAKSVTFFSSADMLIQAWVPGQGLLHAVAAWNGVSYAGMTREVLQRNPATGPSTVVRCRQAPEARRFSELLASGFGISGFFGAEFIEHERTGEVYLLEINRRVTNGVQMGGLVGVDLCAALAAAIEGKPYTGRPDLPAGEEHLIAEFPQEWLRDPESTYLRDARTDVPWDEPELFSAMLAQRHTA